MVLIKEVKLLASKTKSFTSFLDEHCYSLKMAKFRYFRYVLAVVAFYCMIVVNLTRSDLNVTILKMVSNCTGNCTETFPWKKGTECF